MPAAGSGKCCLQMEQWIMASTESCIPRHLPQLLAPNSRVLLALASAGEKVSLLCTCTRMPWEWYSASKPLEKKSTNLCNGEKMEIKPQDCKGAGEGKG